MEATASGILGSWLGQLGIFGLVLAVLVVFMFMWLRESRAVRVDTEGAIARKAKDLERKNAEIAELHDERDELKREVKELTQENRRLHTELMECRFPGVKFTNITTEGD